MYNVRSENTVSIASSSNMSAEQGGPIEKVLVLNGDAASALASLLYELDRIVEVPEVCLARNHREALFELRKAAFGY